MDTKSTVKSKPGAPIGIGSSSSSAPSAPTAQPTISSADSASGAHRTNSPNIMQEIDKINKEIDQLMQSAPKDDPAFKKNINKWVELKKVIAKKTDSQMSSGDVLDRMSLVGKQMDEQKPSNDNRKLPPQNFVNMSLDDSLLYGVDNMIGAIKFVQSLIQKQ